MQNLPDELKTPLVELLLAIADDKLMLGHRAADWTGLGPILEEDIAFSAISQEEIAHASALYEMVGAMQGRRADAVAFGRRPEEYRCAALTTLPDDFDWARAIVRQLFCDHFDVLRFDRLSRSAYTPLASLARRIRAEEATHVEHADLWTIQIGRGGDESRQRMQAALEALLPDAAMLFEPTLGIEALEQAQVYPPGEQDLFERWLADVRRVTDDAGLRLDVAPPPPEARGGRRGQHGHEFAALLDEMCEVYRIEPEAAW
ncbi:MAG: phenylacetate-CoA oxygenase subunit PaaC [Planctomycetes bacterium]|nr:phenylacetate-CoA oxygenase subunit PaaC [Planctomycetota bacterium]